jgi:hypothetical protein
MEIAVKSGWANHISTRLQPGVIVRTGAEPFQRFDISVCRPRKPLKRFSLSGLAYTRLKPGANERHFVIHRCKALPKFHQDLLCRFTGGTA